MADSTLSIVGSITSLIGAAYAAYQAYTAKKSADLVEYTKNKLIGRRKLAELSHLHAETMRILRTLSEVGPTCVKDVRGLDIKRIAQELVDYSSLVKQHTDDFEEGQRAFVVKFCSDVEPLISKLVNASTFNDRKKAGISAYYLVDGFLPSVKLLSDASRESILN